MYPDFLDMHYRHGDNWVTMPFWAISYISLGSAIAILKDSQYRLVIGLATPVRAVENRKRVE